MTPTQSAAHGRALMTPTCSAVAAVLNDDFPKWVVAIHNLDLVLNPIAALTASIDTLVMEHVQRTHPSSEGPPDHTCWGCGKPGHLRLGCPLARPKTRCLHCNKVSTELRIVVFISRMTI